MLIHRYSARCSKDLPKIGIDLGYSTSAKSCGIAYSNSRASESLTFGECIGVVADELRLKGPSILIIEAVLSTYHKPDGNPAVRGDFEKGRGWYHGPGVSTFAAAIRFLDELDKRLPKELRPIPLVEGFLSYKPERTSHCCDAERLVKEFNTAERFTAAEGSEPSIPELDGVPEIRRYNKPIRDQ
ncbi:MAG: hypothetical protein AAF065_00495 [Verrucomicrobiota bacterium]